MIKTSDMSEVERLQAEGKKVVAISGGSPQVFTIDDGKKEEPKEKVTEPVDNGKDPIADGKKEDKRGKK